MRLTKHMNILPPLMLYKQKVLLLYLSICLGSVIVSAQTDTTYTFDDFLDMSLEDLMSIEIVTKTQSESNLQLPFSSFFIVTEKEIVENGFINLSQLLESIPGTTVVDNGFYTTGGQRGINGNFSQSLILFNGREVNGLYSAQTFIANQFATNNIKQVEITQGPGTVLYGSESYAGIINIVTKDYPTHPSKIEVQAEAGSNSWQAFDLLFVKQRDKLKIDGYARLFNTNGFDYSEFVKDEAFYTLPPDFMHGDFVNGINYNNNRFKNGSESINYHVKASYGAVFVGRDFYSFTSEQKGIEHLSLDYNAANGQTSNLAVNFVGLNFPISENTNLLIEYNFTNEKIWGVDRNHLVNRDKFNSEFTQNPGNPLGIDQIYSDFTRFYSQRNSEGSKKHRLKFELTSRIKSNLLSDLNKGDLFLTAGVVRDEFDILELAYASNIPHPDYNAESTSDLLLGLPFFKFTRIESYGQLRKSIINENVFVTLGARHSYHENFDGKLLVRSGVVVNLLDNSYLKASYSQGRRFPSVNELINASFGEISTYNQDIGPSNISSLDLGFSQRFSKNFYWELNAFNLKVEDQILPDGYFSWYNRKEELDILGLETQVNFSVKDLNCQLSYAFKDPSDPVNIYRNTAFLSLGYKIIPSLHLNSAVVMRSKVLTTDGNPELTTATSFEIPSYFSWNLNLTARELFFQGMKITIMGSVKNILNTQQYTPNLLMSGPRQFINPGRQLFARLIINV